MKSSQPNTQSGISAYMYSTKLFACCKEFTCLTYIRNYCMFTLQDVVKHGTSLSELSKQHQLTTSQGEANGNRGIRSLTRVGRKLLDGYQHMFYALQTTPSYLAKLIFCLPLSRSTRFLETVILTLFNFGSNPREEYLLLKLFKTALEEEIRYIKYLSDHPSSASCRSSCSHLTFFRLIMMFPLAFVSSSY